MSMQFISVPELIQYLKENDLVIIKSTEHEQGMNVRRKRMLKRPALSLKEILDLKIMPMRTKKGLTNWIATGKIKASETFVEATGQKRTMILTDALFRLGYGNL